MVMAGKKVIVVGAGPAGLLAAGEAAAAGAQVLLLEKMGSPGRKLAITGKGRCNITNDTPLADFITHFGRDGRFLRQAFSRYFTEDLIEFLRSLGIETVTQRGNRVFPASNRALDVVEALTAWVRTVGVEILPGTQVARLEVAEGRISGVKPGGPRQPLPADAVVIATGGASYPKTGSTGDGYDLACDAGHKITPIRPALVPLETAGKTAAALMGLSLRNANVSVWADGKKQSAMFGEMLFAHFGLTGPVILSLSSLVVDLLRDKRQVVVSIDLKPALDEQKLDARLQRDMDSLGKSPVSALVKGLLPRTLIPVCLDQTGLDSAKSCSQVSGKERRKLGAWLKDFRFTVTGHRPLSEAIITAGGVHLKEINPRTMESKKLPGLYFAGEVLDLAADTGGYNLQAAFSTGWLAGRSAAQPVMENEADGTA
jgi:predicted Rossmann fold flavoprotein